MRLAVIILSALILAALVSACGPEANPNWDSMDYDKINKSPKPAAAGGSEI